MFGQTSLLTVIICVGEFCLGRSPYLLSTYTCWLVQFEQVSLCAVIVYTSEYFVGQFSLLDIILYTVEFCLDKPHYLLSLQIRWNILFRQSSFPDVIVHVGEFCLGRPPYLMTSYMFENIDCTGFLTCCHHICCKILLVQMPLLVIIIYV